MKRFQITMSASNFYEGEDEEEAVDKAIEELKQDMRDILLNKVPLRNIFGWVSEEDC